MEQLRRNWAYRLATSKTCGRTIGRELASAGATTQAEDAAFQIARSAQRFLSVHAAVHNTLYVQHAILFPATRCVRSLQNWRAATAA